MPMVLQLSFGLSVFFISFSMRLLSFFESFSTVSFQTFKSLSKCFPNFSNIVFVALYPMLWYKDDNLWNPTFFKNWWNLGALSLSSLLIFSHVMQAKSSALVALSSEGSPMQHKSCISLLTPSHASPYSASLMPWCFIRVAATDLKVPVASCLPVVYKSSFRCTFRGRWLGKLMTI